jgi:hypothetical protein
MNEPGFSKLNLEDIYESVKERLDNAKEYYHDLTDELKEDNKYVIRVIARLENLLKTIEKEISK